MFYFYTHTKKHKKNDITNHPPDHLIVHIIQTSNTTELYSFDIDFFPYTTLKEMAYDGSSLDDVSTNSPTTYCVNKKHIVTRFRNEVAIEILANDITLRAYDCKLGKKVGLNLFIICYH